jgi:hypothetical protein
MREINTLTREEACEFINAIDIGEFQISRFRYVKRRKAIELDYSYGELYFEFLLAKGFKENQFKTMPPI